MQETWSLQKNVPNTRIRYICSGPHVPAGDCDAGRAHSSSSQLSKCRLETQQHLSAPLARRSSSKPNVSPHWGQSGLSPQWGGEVHLTHTSTGEPFNEEVTAERVEQDSKPQEATPCLSGDFTSLWTCLELRPEHVAGTPENPFRYQQPLAGKVRTHETTQCPTQFK